MTPPLETKRAGRNIHVLIQVEDGSQYLVLDSHFVRHNTNFAHLRFFEKNPERAVERAMSMLSPHIKPRDYEIYNAQALTPTPNYFAVWFATKEQFDQCEAQWTESIRPAREVKGLTPRKHNALIRICQKAALLHQERVLHAA